MVAQLVELVNVGCFGWLRSCAVGLVNVLMCCFGWLYVTQYPAQTAVYMCIHDYLFTCCVGEPTDWQA